jgi:glycosyltransferase involved in cell wall biosynthesis
MKLIRKLHHGYFPRLLWVRGIKKRFRPDATISMLEVPNLINALTPCGDFRIVSERADPSVIGGRYQKSIMRSAMLADHTVFQSRRVQHMFPRKVQKKSSIILNPVSVMTEAADHHDKRIVTAGRLTEQKNHKMLIRAFSRFLPDHSDYILEIYGKGKLKDELNELAQQLGIADSVRICDFAPDLHERISSAEMFVLSSDFEGLSNALLEAMMMGIPCISTACEGSTDVIRSGENGILVPVGDEEELYKAMCALADDEKKRKELACEGRKTGEGFRKEKVAEMWIEMIERVAAEQ